MKIQRGLCVWGNCFLYFGGDFQNEMHSHHPLSIVIGLDGAFQYRLEGQGWSEAEGIFIWPNNSMQYDLGKRNGIILMIDPESADFAQLQSWQRQNEGVTVIPQERIQSILSSIGPYLDQQMQLSLAKDIWVEIIRALAGRDYKITEPDPRVNLVMHAIRKQLTNLDARPINTAILQGITALSESRLLHLFKKETGFTIRHYITSIRIAVATSLIAGGHSATDAAHMAGFSDLAHFSRRFKSMFGLTPSFVTGSSDFIYIDMGDLDTGLSMADRQSLQF